MTAEEYNKPTELISLSFSLQYQNYIITWSWLFVQNLPSEIEQIITVCYRHLKNCIETEFLKLL